MRRTILPRDFRIFPGGQRFEALKELMFSNDTGTITLFNVFGDVTVSIIPVITTDLTSIAGANIRLGIAGLTNAMLADTLSTDLDARMVWINTSPDSEIEPLDAMREYIITDGNDIILTSSGQVDAGTIIFYCFWTPMSSNGQIVVA